MKAIFSKLIQNYDFSPTRFILGGLFLLWVLTHSFCDSTLWASYKRNGKTCYYCAPGFYWTSDCMMTETQALCKPCPSGYFQTSQNIARYCGKCKRCDEIIRNHDVAKVLAPCTSTLDTVCGCKSTHHLKHDPGGNGNGYCQINSMCPAGKGLHKNASYYTDNECIDCISGITFSSSHSRQPCLQCTTTCPNDTYVKTPCNATHDTTCEPSNVFVEPIIINDEEDDSTHLWIGIGVTIAVIAAVAACTLIVVAFICRRRRQTTEPNSQSTQGQQHIVKFHSDSLTNFPTWMKDCLSDKRIDWEKLFGLCYSHILPDWEDFVRHLFVISENGDKGHPSVEEAKEAFSQEKVRSRIYRALTLWKQKCFMENELMMIHIFCKALDRHQQFHNKMTSPKVTR